MKKVSQTGIEKYTEEIGNEGAIMNIRVETTAEGISVNAPVRRNEKKIATLTSESDGSAFLSVEKDANLSPEEFFDIFHKSASVLAQIRGIEEPDQSAE